MSVFNIICIYFYVFVIVLGFAYIMALSFDNILLKKQMIEDEIVFLAKCDYHVYTTQTFSKIK